MGVKIYDRCNARVMFDDNKELRLDVEDIAYGKILIRKEGKDIAIEVTSCHYEPLCRYKIGDMFYTGLRKWIVVEQNKDTTGCLSLDNLWVGQNHKYNNYVDLRKRLNNTFVEALEKQIGSGNIIQHRVKLKDADGVDGLTYRDKASILTLEQYNRYKNVVPLDAVSCLALATPAKQHAVDTPNCLYVAQDGTIQYDTDFSASQVYPFVVFSNKMEPLRVPRNDSRRYLYDD